MPSVELSKLPGAGASRAIVTGERAQIEARVSPNAPAAVGAAVQGITLEVSAVGDAATPPVDAERVRQIKAALRDGSYPLVPTRIADAIIAAQVSLSLPERS